MTTAVDTNALLALLYDDEHADESESALRSAYQDGRLVITTIVYAELAADGHFETEQDVTQFLTDFSIQVVAPSKAALFHAGEQFDEYTTRRSDRLECPSCGAKRSVVCEKCGTMLAPRQHIAADFVIGGHASTDADALISFDTGFYESYFPSLTVYPE